MRFRHPEPDPLGEPGMLGAVGDERHPRREEPAERDRGRDHECRDHERLRREGDRDRDDDRGREGDANGKQPPAPVGYAPDDGVDGDLHDAGGEEHRGNRQRPVAEAVEVEGDEDVERAEEERRQRVEPEAADERTIVERARDCAGPPLLARRRSTAAIAAARPAATNATAPKEGRMPTRSATPPNIGPTTNPNTASPNTVPRA